MGTREVLVLMALMALLAAIGSTGSGFAAAQDDRGQADLAQPATGPEGDDVTGVAAPVGKDAGIPTKNMLQMLRDGGPVMIPIGACSFLLTVFVMERCISLRRSRVIPAPWVKRFTTQLREGQLERESALEVCENNDSAVAKVFRAAVKKWGRPAVEVEQAILDSGERVTNDLRRYLRLFNGISTVTPLLGLLGTVFGMIHSFNTISSADAMGRSELLAKGIGEALLSTAAGLSVAIPALIIYLYFIGRVDRFVMDIDAAGQELVELISAEARAASRTSRKEKAAAYGAETFTMPLKTHLDELPSMNLTSMIDVLFLLIIFFMVGTKFSDMERSLEIQVPKVSDAGPATDAPRTHVISVHRDGAITLDQRPVSVEGLTSELARLQQEYPGLSVMVRGDGEGAFQNVADVLAACRKAGIQKLDVAVQMARREPRR